MHPSTVTKASEKGYQLIITVDNGVAAKEAIEICNANNIEIIVTDHHTIFENLSWDFLLHPTLMESCFEYLCGAGIAYILSLKLIGENDLNACLASIATIGDMVSLKKQNRVIVRQGLEIINKTKIKSICLLTNSNTNIVDENVIAFQIVPKINALGRLSDKYNPNNLVKYFLSNDESEIYGFAKKINEVNDERKNMSKIACEQAYLDLIDCKFNIVKNNNISEGIIGLVAGSVARSTNRPTIVLTTNGDKLKGSARSDGQLDLMEFFNEFEDKFTSFGGHKMACGIEIFEHDFDEFKNFINNKMIDYQFDKVDECLTLNLNSLKIDDFKKLRKYYPFGQGLVIPQFRIVNFNVINKSLVKDIYPKWVLKSNDVELQAISFSLDKKVLDNELSGVIGNIDVKSYKLVDSLSMIVNEIEI